MRYILFFLIICLLFSCRHSPLNQESGKRNTHVKIHGDKFYINNIPTLEGIVWNGINMEGLLPNARLVQGIFDDRNTVTAARWAYPDTRVWDAQRNTNEFIAAMEIWRNHGLLGFTICLQGGSPEGYSQTQPWENTAFNPDGSLRPAYMDRLRRILDRADELGMVVFVGLFYFGQDQRLEDEKAIRNAVYQSVNWLLDKDYRNVLIEISNECDVRAYDHEILKPGRIHELIIQAKGIKLNGRGFYVSTSFSGNTIPTANVVEISDFILLHGNGVEDPDRITEMVNIVREMPEYRTMPIVFNEDDHFDFDRPFNNMLAAFSAGASWGYFDYRMKGEAFEDGFQSVPVDWSINSARKKAFFTKLKEITGN